MSLTVPLELLARAEGGLQQELSLWGPCPGPKMQTMQCYASPKIVGAPFLHGSIRLHTHLWSGPLGALHAQWCVCVWTPLCPSDALQ